MIVSRGLVIPHRYHCPVQVTMFAPLALHCMLTCPLDGLTVTYDLIGRIIYLNENHFVVDFVVSDHNVYRYDDMKPPPSRYTQHGHIGDLAIEATGHENESVSMITYVRTSDIKVQSTYKSNMPQLRSHAQLEHKQRCGCHCRALRAVARYRAATLRRR